ncbi:MAG: hypothetical protein RL328_1168 [Acidobacteriota bacterium]
MFGVDQRTLRVVWTVFLCGLVAALAYRLSGTIIVFTLAVFLAHLLGPIVSRLEHRMPDAWVRKRVSLVIVYLVLMGLAASLLVPLVAQVAEQAAALADQLPAAIAADPLARLPLPAWLEPLRESVTTALRHWLAGFDQELIPILERLGANLGGVLGGALALVLIPILSFFFLKDGRKIRNAFVGALPSDWRPVAGYILNDLHDLLEAYLRALVLLALIVLVVYSIFLSATGVPFPLLLAAVAAGLEIIPVAGPLAASLIIVATALLSGYQHTGWLVAFLIVFRLVQDYWISPQLLAAGIEIHPLWVLFGVLAGEELAGIPGMFFAVPIMAALRIAVLRIRREWS